MNTPEHPAPVEIARAAYDGDLCDFARTYYAAGIAAERARVAAWLREHGRAWKHLASSPEALADSLDGRTP